MQGMKTFALFCFALLITGFALRAQSNEHSLKCNDGNWGNSSRACEIREVTVPYSSRITVDGGQNGSISVKGSDRSDILVRSRVEGWADTEAAAKAITAQVIVLTSGGAIKASGPNSGFGVSYEVFVPRRLDLNLNANNGSLSIANVTGALEFHTVNGSVNLKEIGGDVKGDTRNGGVKVVLTGSRFDGSGLDVSTSNGGVDIKVPTAFSAQFEASTVNGGMRVALPNVVTDKKDRNINVTLGSGGAPIRVRTTNGGVSVSGV